MKFLVASLSWFLPVIVYAFHIQGDQVPLKPLLNFLTEDRYAAVIINPKLNQVIPININAKDKSSAFDILCEVLSLGTLVNKNTIYIAPLAEVVKTKQQQITYKKLSLSAAKKFTMVWQLRYISASYFLKLLAEQHDESFSVASINADARTNKLVVIGPMKVLLRLKQLKQAFDVPVKQIQLQAYLVSIDVAAEQDLGVKLKWQDNSHLRLHTNIFWPNLSIRLSALERQGKAQIVSSPVLYTADQETASIEAGAQIPYQALSRGGGTATVFKKAMLSLQVTPHLLPQDKIVLKLQINQDRPGATLIQGVPTISTNQIITNVTVTAKHTVILGGIYETAANNSREGVPGFKDIPVLRWLFGTKNTRYNRRELLIFVTPKIVD